MHPVPVSAAGSTRTAYGSESHHVRPRQQFWRRVRKKIPCPVTRGRRRFRACDCYWYGCLSVIREMSPNVLISAINLQSKCCIQPDKLGLCSWIFTLCVPKLVTFAFSHWPTCAVTEQWGKRNLYCPNNHFCLWYRELLSVISMPFFVNNWLCFLNPTRMLIIVIIFGDKALDSLQKRPCWRPATFTLGSPPPLLWPRFVRCAVPFISRPITEGHFCGMQYLSDTGRLTEHANWHWAQPWSIIVILHRFIL